MQEKIDFVLIWVDGGDFEWQKQRNIYAGKDPEDVAANRFRDWDNLKYWFRGVEKFAPWVNNIYFITCGHYPKWLNLNNPKLKFLKHSDYIPEEYLPTFNSHTIELNFHRIKDLSEKFVYFNDDMFLINDVKQEDFFENGKPKHIVGLGAIATENNMFNHILLNNVFLMNKYANKNDFIKKNFKDLYRARYGFDILMKTTAVLPFTRFTGFYTTHTAEPILKSTIKELWEKEHDIFHETSKDKFRNMSNINQYVFSWYDIVRGNFAPARRKDYKHFSIPGNESIMLDEIKSQKYKMICINDASTDFDFEKVKRDVIDAFEEILPEKSSFEV